MDKFPDLPYQESYITYPVLGYIRDKISTLSGIIKLRWSDQTAMMF